MSSERRSPPQWKLVPGLGDDGGRTIRIHCGTPEIAELVRQIDLHGRLGTLVDTQPSSDPDDSSWIAIEQPPGEPLHHLIDRLGSRPPPVLVDAWCHQLAQIEAALDAAELPFHSGSVDDLRVDSAARLHIAYLPLRIAESICQAEPDCGQQGSLLPWLRSRQEIDLGGFDFLAAAIESLAPSPALSEPAIASAAAAVAPSGLPRRRGGNRSKPAPLRLWIAGATAAAILIALAVIWSGRADKAPRSGTGGAEGESAPQRAAARPAEDDSSLQVNDEHRPLHNDAPLVRLADGTGIGGRDLESAGGGELVLPSTDPSGLAGAPVAPVRSGLEVTENQPPVETSLRTFADAAETAMRAESEGAESAGAESAGVGAGEVGAAEIRPTVERSAASGQAAPGQAASGQAVDLPMRDQTEPIPIPGLAGVAVAAMSTAVLQSPGGKAAWRLVVESDAAATPANSAREPQLRIVSEDADGMVHTAAVLRNERANEAGTGEWSWAWTAEAADMPGAEQLRNSRLSIDGRQIYLRTTTTAEGVRIRFDQPQQSEEWSLVTAAAPRRSHISLTAEGAEIHATADASTTADPSTTAETGATAESSAMAEARGEVEAGEAELGRPLSIQWLQAVESEVDRSVRGLAEIRDSEGSPIAVRVRFDIQAGRSIELETQSVATIEASSGWQPASRQGVSEAQDRANAQQLEMEQSLRVIAQQYPGIEDREARSAMRARREALEEQQKLLAEWTERLGQLQVLMARIATEVQWQIELRTEWPDTSQAIFVSR